MSMLNAFRRFMLGTACVVSLAAGSTTAVAQTYPLKPIRIVVPFAPGSGTDILARAAGEKLAAAWGQPVLVDNVPGAGGTIGIAQVARAPNSRPSTRVSPSPSPTRS